MGGLTARDLQELDDWLTLAQILASRDPDSLKRLSFYESAQQLLLAHLAVELGEVGDPERAGLGAAGHRCSNEHRAGDPRADRLHPRRRAAGVGRSLKMAV